jgi:hypothetical protein
MIASLVSRLRGAVTLAAAVWIVGIPLPTAAHETGVPFVFVGATADGGGALAIEHGFAAPIELAEDAQVGGLVRYTATDPSFEPPEDEDAELFFLDDGTTVRVEITAVSPGAAIKLSGVELVEVGDAVVLGTAPNLHQHPVWQLTLPEGATDCRPISFRLTTDSPTYAASESYTAYLTNDETTCEIPTAPACGDPDGSGSVTVSDGVNVLRAAAGLSSTCATEAACDVDGSGATTVTDGVNVLRAAAGLSADLACPDL